MTVLKEDRLLDCSGMLCPIPVIKTSKSIKEMLVGEVLKMISTDPGAPADMAAWARQTGNELMDAQEEGGKYIFYLKRLK